MRILFIFIAFSVLTKTAAQTSDKRIDSLNALLKSTRDPKISIDILNALAVRYYNIDLKKSQNVGQDALEQSRKINYDRGTQQAMGILMRVHRRMGNFSVAIEYSLSKIPIAERLKDTLDLIDSYSSLGNIYSSLERYDESRQYLKRAYVLGEKIDIANLASIMNYIGRGYGKAGRYDSAEYWINKALQRELARPQRDYSLSYIYNNLAEVFYYKKDLDKAREYYTQSLNLPTEKKSQFGVTFTLNGLAKIHNDLKEYKEAIDLIIKSLSISKAYAYRDKTKEAYGILHEIYEGMDDYKNALYYYKLFNL